MTMGKSELDRCVDQLCEARERARIAEDFDGVETTAHALIQAVAHLAEYCRARVADYPAPLPHELHSTIENLLARIEALESTAEALYARADTVAEDEPAEALYARADTVAEDEPAEACPAEWTWLLTDIQEGCKKRNWSDTDAYVAWMMGRDALLRARSLGVRFPHD